MPAPTTPDEFFELVKRSRLVDEARLLAHARKLQESNEWHTDVSRLAGFYIRDGILTKFQAEQFLQGKWKRFELGKYRVLERLGAGGMGQVYLCEHKLMRRRVAVKVLPANKSEDPSALERFHREARVVAALDHPNIVRAYDIDADGQLHFLVMEYVDGSSLQDIVKQHGPMDPIRASHYIAQAALGLQHAHEVAAIVHRDIKPGNLLLDRNGVLKILDMGLARFFHDEEDQITRNHDESVLGTADYLAPEQAIDSHTVDIRADIYSLGATFYFLLTGQPPFPTGTIAQKLIWHQTREPQPIRTLRPEVPEALAEVVSKMMQKNPAARFQLPIEVAQALVPWTQIPIPPPAPAEMPQLSPAAMGSPAAAPPSRVVSRPSYANLMLPPALTNSGSSMALPALLPEVPPTTTPTMMASPAPPPVAEAESSKPPSSKNNLPSLPGGYAVPGPGAAPPPSKMNLPALPESVAPPVAPVAPVLPITPVPVPSLPITPPPAPRLTQGLPPLDPISAVNLPPMAAPPSYADQPLISTPATSNPNPLTLNNTGQPEPWDSISDHDGMVAVAKPSSHTTRPASQRKLGKYRWLIAGVAIVLAVGGVAVLALRPKSATQAKLPKTEEPRIFKVSAAGDGTHKRLIYALAETRPGDHIVLLDESITESVQIVNQRDLTIEAGHPSGYVKWLAPVEGRQLLNLESCESVKLKGIRFDAANRIEVGVRLAKDCRGVVLEDVHISGARRVGMQLANCLGTEQAPLKITHCRIETPPNAEAAIRLFAHMKTGSGVAQFIHLHDCLLIGQRPNTAGLIIDGAILDTRIEQVTIRGFADGVKLQLQQSDQSVSVTMRKCRLEGLQHGLHLLKPVIQVNEASNSKGVKFAVVDCDFVDVAKMVEVHKLALPVEGLLLQGNTRDAASKQGNIDCDATNTPIRPEGVGSTLQ
jgi:serine/threonine protein kinase